MCHCQFLLLCLPIFALYTKYYGAPILCADIFTLLYLLLRLIPWPLYSVLLCLLYYNSHYFKVYFVWYKYCYSRLLLISTCMESCSHTLTFCLYVSLDLMWSLFMHILKFSIMKPKTLFCSFDLFSTAFQVSLKSIPNLWPWTNFEISKFWLSLLLKTRTKHGSKNIPEV